MAFHLTDDGTLDTVVTCDDCGHDERYSADTDARCDACADALAAGRTPDGCAACRDIFIEYVLEDANEGHDCPRHYMADDEFGRRL